MIFRNLKTGNLLVTENEGVIEMMTSSPHYQRVPEAVATPTAPPVAPDAGGNSGGDEGGESTPETPEAKPDKKTKK